jgi:hypothetical protein
MMPYSPSASRHGHGLVPALCVAMLVIGCSRNADVSGVVRVGGKPIRGLLVSFEPEAKGLPRGVARTDDDGRFMVRSLGVGAATGLPAGRYAVVITADVDDEEARRIPDQILLAQAITHEVVVGGDNALDIDLPAK